MKLIRELKLGCTLEEALERISFREYRMWLAFFQLEMNDPSRADWYAMQVAQSVKGSVLEDPGVIKLKDQILEFKEHKKPKKMDPDTKTKIARSIWFAATGFNKENLHGH